MVSGRLHRLLSEACPAGLVTLYAPLDVALGEVTVVQPDLLVARRADFTERDLPMAPLLALEILSPSTRLIDLELKKARYQAAGCPSYRVVDPAEAALVAWDLQDGEYVETARVTGSQSFTATAPFPVQITPAALLT